MRMRRFELLHRLMVLFQSTLKSWCASEVVVQQEQVLKELLIL